MKHLGESRDANAARRVAAEISPIVSRPWAIMGVCGGQNHSIIRHVRIIYSPLDAVKLAWATPGREVVFLAIGFETNAPANAMAVQIAARE